MLTNCLATCAHLTITVSEIERDIGRKSSIFHTPLHSTPPLGGSRRNIATPFGMEKLEWCGYPMVKKFQRYLYSFWRNSRNVTDAQTDRRTPGDGIYRAYAYASRGKNSQNSTKMTIGVPVVTIYAYRCPLRIVCAERTIYLR